MRCNDFRLQQISRTNELYVLQLSQHIVSYFEQHCRDHAKNFRLFKSRVGLWRRANARNVRFHYPYRQYTNLFIFRFVSLLCLRSTLRLFSFNFAAIRCLFIRELSNEISFKNCTFWRTKSARIIKPRGSKYDQHDAACAKSEKRFFHQPSRSHVCVEDSFRTINWNVTLTIFCIIIRRNMEYLY